MTAEEHTTTTKTAPTCYRHHDRETWVSCGRCGRPLCPDCVKHGPVGVRCAECLRPQRKDIGVGAPENVGVALGVGLGEAAVWVILLIASGWFSETFAPNILLSGIAGGLVGWSIWRISGRTHDSKTLRFAVALGLAMPIIAALLLAGLLKMSGAIISTQMLATFDVNTAVMLAVRACVAAVVSGLFAWLFISKRA